MHAIDWAALDNGRGINGQETGAKKVAATVAVDDEQEVVLWIGRIKPDAKIGRRSQAVTNSDLPILKVTRIRRLRTGPKIG